jgi:hypothetical protein
LTVGNARQLARKNLGKRHLVYFFECHEAPFCVLTTAKLTIWEDGLLDDHHLGKAAKAAGRVRSTIFQQALQAATVEAGKPIEMRLDWNHTEQPQILPSPKMVQPKRKSVTKDNNNNNSNRNKGSKKRRRESRGSAETSVGSFPNEPSTSKASRGRAFGFLPEPPRSASSLAPQTSTRRNLTRAMESLASASTAVAAHIESSEDGVLYCKLLKKLTSESIVNVGFVKLTSRKKCTFAQARTVIEQTLVPDCIDADSNWKFFVPTLGPVSLKQEESLGPLYSFLQDTTSDAGVGNGSLRHPLKVIIVDSPL